MTFRASYETIVLRAALEVGFEKRLRQCDVSTRALARRSQEHSEDVGVEGAWLDLGHSVERLERAVAQPLDDDAVALVGRNAAALERLYQELRRRVGLAPDVRSGGSIATDRVGRELRDEHGKSLGATRFEIRDNVLSIWDEREGAAVHTAARITGTDRVDAVRYRPGTLPAADELRWGAWLDEAGRIVAGPLESDGRAALSPTAVTPGPAVWPQFAVGDGEAKWIIHMHPQLVDGTRGITVSSSSDSGVTWSHRGLPATIERVPYFFPDVMGRSVWVCEPSRCQEFDLGRALAMDQLRVTVGRTHGLAIAGMVGDIVVLWTPAGRSSDPMPVVRLTQGDGLDGLVEWDGILYVLSVGTRGVVATALAHPPR